MIHFREKSVDLSNNLDYIHFVHQKMEAEKVGFIQEALRGFLKCLGLDSGGGNVAAAGGEVVVNNPPPPSTAYEPLPSPADDHNSTADPLVDVLSSPINESPTIITTDTDNNPEAESNFSLVTIDELLNTGDGMVTDVKYVEVVDGGRPNMDLLATRLISSGGGGTSH